MLDHYGVPAYPDHDRPRLLSGAAVVDRQRGLVQVGADGSVVFAAAARGLLTALDGRTRADQLSRRSGVPACMIDPVLRALTAAGLLMPTAPSGAVCLIGHGPMIIDLSAHLTSRELLVTVVDHDIRCASAEPVGEPDLVVVALGTGEAERGTIELLRRGGQPHLIIDAVSGGVRIGPLVDPGFSPCRRCLDLYRTDRDPEWPMVAAQLATLPAEPDPLVQSWAASTAVVQILAFLAGERPFCLGGTIELSIADWLPRTRRWPAHPRCCCGCRVVAPHTAGIGDNG